MKKSKKLVALLLALVMVLGLAACGGPTGEESQNPTGTPASSNNPDPSKTPDGPDNPPAGNGPVLDPIEPDGSDVAAKWTEKTTEDGWIEVTNEGGKTLGYHPSSGVQIIQVDGFAFKDLNKDGKLNGYEDWRNSDEVRAKDLAWQMSGEEIAPYLTHGGWGTYGATYPADDAYVNGGGRGGVTRNVGSSADANVQHAQWVNSLEALCEKLDWGIPAVVSIDPNGQSGMTDTLALAATMDPDFVFEIGKAYGAQYRAAGVHALLGPQIDLASTAMARGNGTYGEDPALTRDVTDAFISGLQSTFDANGNDLGWGIDSVASFTKHYTAAGAGEAGRDDHSNEYAVFPGNNFEAHLIAFHDGAFRLTRSSTGKASGVMMNYSISYSEDKSLGEWVGGAFSDYKYALLEADGWHGYIITDWVPISGGNGSWGYENPDYTDGERAYMAVKSGMTSAGGYSNLQGMLDGWEMMVDEEGEEEALEIMRARAYENILCTMNLGLFDNPYSSTARVRELNWSTEALALALESKQKGIVMLKNDGTIAQGANSDKTVYIPAIYTAGSQGSSGYNAATIKHAIDPELAAKYFANVITDSWGDPTGKDPDGNAEYQASDIKRAANASSADIFLAPMTAPWTASTVEYDDDGNLKPVTPRSIQYGEYTATAAREKSLAGDRKIITFSDGYTTQTREEVENRSYKGQSVGKASNYGDLEMLQYVKGIAGSKPVVVLMTGANTGTMVWSEVEPMADAIIWTYSSAAEALLQVAAGEVEPTGLLVIGMPKDMDATETELEDVPRDQELYVDANGNTYGFTFGMNWSGVIKDGRVSTYNVAPLTKVQGFTYFTAS